MRCVKGRVLDVAVDIRKDSPTYVKHVAVELTEDNHVQFFILKGFAHGFAVLSEIASSSTSVITSIIQRLMEVSAFSMTLSVLIGRSQPIIPISQRKIRSMQC